MIDTIYIVTGLVAVIIVLMMVLAIPLAYGKFGEALIMDRLVIQGSINILLLRTALLVEWEGAMLAIFGVIGLIRYVIGDDSVSVWIYSAFILGGLLTGKLVWRISLSRQSR